MNPLKLFVIIVAWFNLSTLVLFPAEAKELKLSPESKLIYNETEDEGKCWTENTLGYWFKGLQWLGVSFDSGSFKSTSPGDEQTDIPESIFVLLRHHKGQFQPYMGVNPGLLISEKGLGLEFRAPSVVFGLSYSF
ncbi:MAG: hypothetical protein JSU72_00490 [Deltaproteobacteria bacterium]|nr:MAG: hypothetical protein JSU72_00490 [Deltaproteobacteria bacterium]